MLTASPRSPSARRSAGFALLIVLWTLVLIAFLVLHLTASGRTEIRIANNLQSNAIAAAAADGAISAAIFALSAPQPDQRWTVNGPTHQLTIGNCQVVVQLDNEAARINPSLAPPALMESLLRAVGSPPDNARSIAEAIGDWVGSAQTPKTADVLKAEYQAAGLDYAPPGGPLESIGRAQPGSGHDPGAFCGVAAPSDAVWPGATGSHRRRSGRRRCDCPNAATRSTDSAQWRCPTGYADRQN